MKIYPHPEGCKLAYGFGEDHVIDVPYEYAVKLLEVCQQMCCEAYEQGAQDGREEPCQECGAGH